MSLHFGYAPSISFLLLVSCICFSAKALLKFFADYGAARVSVGFGTKLRFQMAKSLSNANGAFFKGAATGQFANAFNVEASKSQGYSVTVSK